MPPAPRRAPPSHRRPARPRRLYRRRLLFASAVMAVGLIGLLAALIVEHEPGAWAAVVLALAGLTLQLRAVHGLNRSRVRSPVR